MNIGAVCGVLASSCSDLSILSDVRVVDDRKFMNSIGTGYIISSGTK